MTDESIPYDKDAEKAVLGAIQLNNALIEEVTQSLGVEDFFLDAHRQIFRALLNLHSQGMAIDLITLKADLEARGVFNQVGGFTYICSLIDDLPRMDTAAPYIRILKAKSTERNALYLCRDAVDALLEGEELPEVIIERTTRQLSALQESRTDKTLIQGFYPTLEALFSAELRESEIVFSGVRRGEVAGFSAVTNFGKSTLLMNLCLSLSAGEICFPLAPEVGQPRRVLFLDCEAPASEFRSDVRIMLRQIRNASLARQNFIPVVDATIAGEPLCLSRHQHFERVLKLAKEHKADVVVIDTAPSAFELQDENSNAEVTRKVMNPLKRLAREGNCAVVYTHHIGKANETQSGEGAYKGRGASAFGTLSRAVFTLEKDVSKGSGYVVLSCAKSKGTAIEPTLLKLNPETRWFEICAEKPTPRPEPPSVQEIIGFIGERGEATTDQIKRHFRTRAGERTIADRIKEAESLRLIHKANQKAPWRLCNDAEGFFADIPQAIENAADSAFVQSATPIGIAQTHKPSQNGHKEFVYCVCGSSGIQHSHCMQCGEFLY